MRNHQQLALLVLTVIFTAIVLAQTIAPLPKIMSGRWTAVIPGGRTFTGTMSVVLHVPAGMGPLTGRLTSRGVTCGAVDEPLTGTWDGNELRFESQVRPNVNAQRSNGECGTGRVTYVLTRKSGQTTFEGESRRDAAPAPAQITLAP